jgi:hypothetical protein
MPGISVLPLTPPKAEPRHTRPVTSWNLDMSDTLEGLGAGQGEDEGERLTA